MPERLSVTAVLKYCQQHRLCTGMDSKQYEIMLGMCHTNYLSKTYLHDIALLIWFCSTTEKDVPAIIEDLRKCAIYVEGN